MDKYVSALIEEFGEPQHRISPSIEVIRQFQGKLPAKLLEYWQELGFSGFAGGLFWITNPDVYAGALKEWIGGTKIAEEEPYYVIGRTGFGDLHLWSAQNGHKYTAKPSRGLIMEHERDHADITVHGADYAVETYFAIINRLTCDMEDSNDEPIFDRAVVKFGPLAEDEVFAYEPSLILGGDGALEHIAKRNIHVHLSLLRQFAEPEILDQEALKRKAFS